MEPQPVETGSGFSLWASKLRTARAVPLFRLEQHTPVGWQLDSKLFLPR